MWNAGSAPERILEIVIPAGLEQFFREVAKLGEAGPPDPAAVADLGVRYDLTFTQPEWLPDVIARHRSMMANAAYWAISDRLLIPS